MAATELTGRRLNQYIEDYVVFDLETTGVDTQEDSIIEISAVKVKHHVITEEFNQLINPGTHIPAGATKINGITDEMVKEAPFLSEVLPDFLSFIGKEVLVGHNIQSFDLLFLYRTAGELMGVSLPNDYIDTLFMARERLPQLYRHRLTDISAHFNISTEGAHRALNDCRMNQQCYEQMGKLTGTEEVYTCPQCGGLLKKRNGRFGVFYGCTNYPRCRFTKNG
ncbi:MULTISPECIES: exonuclease domain-containing protein [Lacrimispora]|uniref:exonuclease domain-containing protein n=1 Tax=Lacrimispora TaxID=2719231 RepID=UPI000BE2D404|nr:exonuclease domain-containing protein [Lacrimispora amygdalina]MDK2967477.1 polymerase subunit epsilon [Lacrimispora sp.]